MLQEIVQKYNNEKPEFIFLKFVAWYDNSHVIDKTEQEVPFSIPFNHPKYKKEIKIRISQEKQKIKKSAKRSLL